MITREQKSDNLTLLLLALAGILIHILLNGQYGFHRDELDVIMNARQPWKVMWQEMQWFQ